MASDLVPQILDVLASSEGPIRSDKAFPTESSFHVKAGLDRLASREMVTYKTLDREVLNLTAEGESIADGGSPEAKVFEAVRSAIEGLKIQDLSNVVGKDVAKIGSGNAFKKGWIKKDKNDLSPSVETVVDDVQQQLRTIRQTNTYPDAKVVAELRKRRLLTTSKVINFEIAKGPKFAREFVKEETDLTVDMLANGSWKTAKLKPYNFKAKGAVTPSGALHPLNKVRNEFRHIFFEMGFEEMPTNRFVETGFWNFDALFVPQQHPARDLQDTFYISDPAIADKPRPDHPDDPHLSHFSRSLNTGTESKKLDYEEYWNNVRAVHETGKYGSIGYRYPFIPEESLRLVLRTHTTSVSTYMLHRLAANPRPARYFSIDRVFRNETVDDTHLAEFHQIEGVIADFGLALGGLIGFMEVFFAKMGINGLRFKPAYNPYTEPSMEIFGYHEGLGKWVEIGNSGMFRAEMLEAMGLPSDMRVYGWGLSLERPTMIKYKVSNIRDLVGHKVDLNFIETNPAVRLEKN